MTKRSSVLARLARMKTPTRCPVNGEYVGHLSREDPLQDFLARILRDRMRIRIKSVKFQVYRLPGINENYCYQEESTRVRVVCKFYGGRFSLDPDQGARVAQQEYDNLNILRGYGFARPPYHVVEPFGIRSDINAALAIAIFPW